MKYINYKPSERILKECFWDYKLSVKDLDDHVHSADWRVKKFVFDKIFCNSLSLLIELMIFSKNDMEQLIIEYKVQQFNHDYLERRHKIIRHILLGEEVSIKELEWRL
jgi:hypothetical protein